MSTRGGELLVSRGIGYVPYLRVSWGKTTKGISHMRTSFTKRFTKNRFLSGLAATGVAALILTGCAADATETATESDAAVVAEETVVTELMDTADDSVTNDEQDTK